MKQLLLILSILILSLARTDLIAQMTHLNFCGEKISFQFDQGSRFNIPAAVSTSMISSFYEQVEELQLDQVLASLQQYREKNQPDDWLYYQLIRRVANSISPKAENYERYTLYKWILLAKSGYDVLLTTSGKTMLFYVRCDENTYNIPNKVYNGKQYACLNYHDYPGIELDNMLFTVVDLAIPNATKAFSYKITALPYFPKSDYKEKDIRFNYYENEYRFKIQLNSQIKSIFTNYPVVDYESYLNIPISQETYQSLIPILRKNLKGMTVKNGVDYLMRFTRYAFLFENDTKVFGGEKRLSPEQTLLYDQSDCEDRVALFYFLVKEVYNLPMIVISYPNHVTIAVNFEKPIGNTVVYNGKTYSICEPTPQKTDLQIGQLLPELLHSSFKISYVYNPGK